MIKKTFRGGASAALSIAVLSACAPAPETAQSPVAPKPTVAGARVAGMLALDLLAPAWGAAARDAGSCDARYMVEPLRARCEALKREPDALAGDLPQLETLAGAMRDDAMANADAAWLRAADAVFAPLIGRAPPKGAKGREALARLDERLRPMLARPAPGYGAASLTEALSISGKPLTSAEIAALAPFVAAMERRLADWDRAARGAALLRVAEYGAALARRRMESER